MQTNPSGTPPRRLTELKRLGFEIDFVKDLAGLTASLNAGLPAIALLWTASLSYWSASCDHVAVVVGIDDSWVYLNDPFVNAAPQQVSQSDFLLAWSHNACMVAIVRPRP